MSLSIGIAQLNEFKVANAAHDLGVAVAYILASRLGYSWVALAEDMINPTGPPNFHSKKCPDMLFERGDRSNCLIAIEAKGRTRKHSTGAVNQLHRDLEEACREQVGNVIGHSTSRGSIIVHGYAVGAWVPRGGPPGSYHVCEIDRRTSPSVQYVQTPLDSDDDRPETPLAITAAQTYMAGTRLVGDHSSENALRSWISEVSVRDSLKSVIEEDGSDEFEDSFSPGIAEYGNETYRIGPPIPGHFFDPTLTGVFHFALNVKTRAQLLSAVSRGVDSATEFLNLGRRRRTSETEAKGFTFVDPNGLALLYSDEIEISESPNFEPGQSPVVG